jgi:hypothetical protein
MRRKNEKENDREPSCRVIWSPIPDQDWTAQQRADWTWLWGRLLTPAPPKTVGGISQRRATGASSEVLEVLNDTAHRDTASSITD